MKTSYNDPSARAKALRVCVMLLLFVNGSIQAQVRLVADLDPDKKVPFQATKLYSQNENDGGRSFFTAEDSELWTSDGTTTGTKVIRRFVKIQELEVMNGLCYLSAQSEDFGFELWISNGTAGGTRLLKDIYPGRGSSTPLHLTRLNGRIYFSANNNTNGRELWKSDGTVTGTQLVKDIFAGSANSLPDNLEALGSKLFFTARTESSGVELWSSDGTPSGTVMVKDIYPGITGAAPQHLTASNGWVFFSAESLTPIGRHSGKATELLGEQWL
jgi:ELWxxDGT repeat protein